MSLRPSCLVLMAAAMLGSGAAAAQDIGLRRLSPAPILIPQSPATPPRRAAQKPAPARPAPTPTPTPTPTPRATPVTPVVQSTPAPRPTPARPAAVVATAPRPAPPPIGGAIGGPIGGKPVIIIDSRRIGDPTGAVIEVARASRQVMQEFESRTDELRKLKAEADKTQAAAAAARGREKETLAATARLQRAEFETRNAALEKAFKARSDTLLSPVQTRINDSLKAFAVAQGATIVLDGARFNAAVLAMRAGTDPASLDLTTAFIESYNRTHP